MRACAVCAGIVSLAGCAQEPQPEGLAKHLCRSWHPISISKRDKLTDQTAKEIAGTNAAQGQWCPLPKQPGKVS